MEDNLEGWEEVKEQIDRMDIDKLRISAMMMVRRLGTTEALKSIREAELLMNDGEGPVCAPSYEEMHEEVYYALMRAADGINMDFDYDLDDDELEESLWAQEKYMICSNIDSAFGDLVQEILEDGDESEAQKVIDGISEALLDRDIPWTETLDRFMDFRRAYVEAIQERFRNKEFDILFEEFDYDETA